MKHRTRYLILRCIMLCLAPAPMTAAQDAEAGAEDSSEPDEEAEPSRVSLGARGFAGILVEDSEVQHLFGGGLLVGIPIYQQLELEGSLMLASKREPPVFLVTELVAKWVFESEQVIAPHLTVGPLFSLDLTDPVEVSVGLIAGAGLTLWATPRFGGVLDINYRLLVGSEVSHAATGALGIVFRPF